MSKLKAIDPKSAEPSKPKILIYGKPGVGKTWTSLDFPNVFYIDVEQGANRSHYTDKLKASGGVYLGAEQGSTDFNVVIEQTQALATEKHKFKTLVIDSVSKLFLLRKTEEAEKGGDDFGRDKKQANKPARKLMSWLNKIDMNVILISHEIPLWGTDSKGERSQIGVTYDAWDKLDYDLDLCLNIIRQGDRRIAKVSKSRLLSFPDASTFTWSYDEFAKLYGKEVIEKQGEVMVLATVEQVKELNDLIALLNIQSDVIEKWLKKEEVEAFAEMSTANIQKYINAVKAKLPKVA